MVSPDVLTADGILYQHDARRIRESQLYDFVRFCERERGDTFTDYVAFDTFAATEFRAFWAMFLRWSCLLSSGEHEPVCLGDDCETAQFFPGLQFNYAENLLRNGDAGGLIGCHADGSTEVVTKRDLRERVVQLATSLRRLGVRAGDRVAAIARNNVEVIVAALAVTSLGAIFSSCQHDLGAFTVLSRFQRLEPKLLFANCASRAWDVGEPLPERIAEIVAGLPSLTAVITLDDIVPNLSIPVYRLQAVLTDGQSNRFVWQRFPFNHPLFILFSSGTTGLPKCIIHSVGGTLLEHAKEHRLHCDLASHDILFFQTSCGWMMWNWQLSALLCGAMIVVYDGPLLGPDTLWEIVARQQVTVFGTNPAYLRFSASLGYAPSALDLAALRVVLSTGSILYPNQFDWIVEQVKRIPVQSISGGTDILGCFVLGNPMLPVYRGMAQCRSLGLDVRARPSPVGELVCLNPFPSRPIGFFGEPVARYHDAYFAQNPGMWTHGDMIEVTPQGVTMLGRSDGILNIRGVRIGPAEIYRILQAFPEIVEAMAVEQVDEQEPGGARLILLVVLTAGIELNDVLIRRIRATLQEDGNAFMVPAAIIQMAELPVTHSGKRSETSAHDAVNGRPVRNRSALANPDCLDGIAEKLQTVQAELPSTAEFDDNLERTLCRLCQRIMRSPAVRPTDNFIALGGDSLSVLEFLIAAANRTHTSVPLPALIEVSTVRDLVNLLRTGRGSSNADLSRPRVRAQESRDTDGIVRLLAEGFSPTIPWDRIFTHLWQPESIPRGYVMTTPNEGIVGFVGLIAAQRNLGDKSGIIANLTSWYVQSAFRAWSGILIAAATQNTNLTYTSLTPNRRSRRFLKALGFTDLDGGKVLVPALPYSQTLARPQPEIVFGARAVRPLIGNDQRRILDDHDGCDFLPLFVSDAGGHALIIAKVQHYRDLGPARYSEILYCSDSETLARHIRGITRAVLKQHRTLFLCVGRHLLPKPMAGIMIPSYTMMRSSTFASHDIDKLYSELTLLPVG